MTIDFDHQIRLLEAELRHLREMQQIQSRHSEHHDASTGLLVIGMKQTRDRLDHVEQALESAADQLNRMATNLYRLTSVLLAAHREPPSPS